jgi:hypothetical protein
MAFQANIKITGLVGAGSGPCDIYQSSDFFSTPIATGVSITSLQAPAGVDVACNPGTTILRIQNTGTCTNFENVSIMFS